MGLLYDLMLHQLDIKFKDSDVNDMNNEDDNDADVSSDTEAAIETEIEMILHNN